MNKLKVIRSTELELNKENERYYHDNELYSGLVERYESDNLLNRYHLLDGVLKGVLLGYDVNGEIKLIGSYNDVRNGYFIEFYEYGMLFTVFDMESIIEILKVGKEGNRLERYSIDEDATSLKDWKLKRNWNKDNDTYGEDFDIVPYYDLQNELKKKVIENSCLGEVKYVAGVDVSYNELLQKMVGAIVVLDANTLEVIEESSHEMEITFPYIPGLFSFREIPPLIEAYNKLEIKPDLIVCDGHGIAHPKGVGMATHLGIELNVPTIGCAKTRLVGAYERERLGKERGSTQSLKWDNKEVGVALRTQTGINPLFVSIGHKVDLETSISWVLELCPNFRLPETTRQADKLVNTIMKEKTEYDLYGDDKLPNHPA